MAEECEEFTIFCFVPGGPELEGWFESKEVTLKVLAEYQDEKNRERTIAFRKNPETGLITARLWPDGSETPVVPSDFPSPDIWEYFEDCLE